MAAVEGARGQRKGDEFREARVGTWGDRSCRAFQVMEKTGLPQ